jgi:cyclic pyranopterin phosphate synthase
MQFRSYLDNAAVFTVPQALDSQRQLSSPQLQDRFQRSFSYLRLSLTDKCNFRCQYCLPNGYIARPGEPAVLTRAEITRLVRGFSALGLRKVRLTGGEPSLRKDLTDIIADISTTSDVQKVVLSTNGYRLARDVKQWQAAGLSAVNVSIDSLEPARFASLTGSDNLALVLRGIDQALDAGLSQVKINTVLLAQTDATEILRFFDYVRLHPVTVRFIELMETGGTTAYFDQQRQSADRLLSYLHHHGWQAQPRNADSGPAIEFIHPDYLGRIGVIAPYSKGFCDSCNRLRVTAQGQLLTCLFATDSQPLRPLLQSDDQQNALQQHLQKLIRHKSATHQLQSREAGLNHGFSAMGG